MGLRWASLTAAVTLIVPQPLLAQRVTELGAQVIGLAGETASLLGGGYGAVRTSLRSRISLGVGARVSAGKAVVRAEALGHFLLNPTRQRGAGLYLAGGVAAVGGAVDAGYIVLALGVEGRPGAATGWFVEAGVGGGARVAAGYKRRWLPAGWPY
jgi:hypothetical protein